jgi:hypothetical protein
MIGWALNRVHRGSKGLEFKRLRFKRLGFKEPGFKRFGLMLSVANA